ncbi:MAG: pyridoxal phosphate-dependent aminotransferase [Desulfobacterales bacterium]|nr:MAG: pyridoxal phosphate-dependent aminotransferase [Desulfobacterales bacterium]
MLKQPLSQRTEKIRLSTIREVANKVEEARKRGIEIISFSAGRPDFDTPHHIKDAAKKALDNGLVHYTASMGTTELREAICQRFQEDYQLNLDPDEIIATMGSTEAIYIGMQSILNPGDEVIIPEPMYLYYGGWSLLGEAEPITFALQEQNDFLIDAENLKQHVTGRTKAFILTSPHNPTGQVIEENEIRKIAELAIKKDFYIICDDVYNYFLYDGAKHHSIAKVPGMRDRTLIIGSFSKTYAMDGWRIGYLIAPRQVIARALKMHQYAVNCCNSFVQAGAQVALTASQNCVREMVQEFDRRRRLLLSYLDDLRIPYVRPRGAFYVFPSIKKFGLSSKQFSDYLLREARVAVVPGDGFGPAGEGYVRMAFCLSCEEIEKGMESVAESLKKI